MTELHEIFSFTCRCCTRCEVDNAQNTLKLQSLYSSPPEAIVVMSIAEIFTKNTTRLVISQTDELPQMICLSCVEKVQQMQTFLDMCIESEKNMRCILENRKGKTNKQETLNMDMLSNGTIIKKKQNLQANSGITEIMLDAAIKEENELEEFMEQNITDNLLATPQQPTSENPLCIESGKNKKSHCTETTLLLIHNENIVKDELQIIEEEIEVVDGVYNKLTNSNSIEIQQILQESTTKKDLQTEIDISFNSSDLHVVNEPLIDDNSQISNSTFEEGSNCEFEQPEAQEKDDTKEQHLKSKNKKIKDKPKEPPFICNICNKRFTQKVNLQTHTRIHTGEKPFKCEYCNRAFKQKVHLIEHLHLHLGENVYQCKYCPSDFRQNSELRIHSKEHQTENAETREKNLTARKARHLEIQKNNIPRERTYECNLCDKKFYESITMQNHLATHTVERPYKCKYCDYATKNQQYLNNHLRKHLGLNIHLCTQCPLGFRFISELRTHREVHRNEDAETREENLKARKAYQLELDKNIDRRVRNFECEQCYKRFYKNSMLIKHMQTHTVAKSYLCKFCSYAGINRDYLSKHLRLHLGNYVHMCKICPLDFRLYSELRTHSEVHKYENAETREKNLAARQEKDVELMRKLKTSKTKISY